MYSPVMHTAIVISMEQIFITKCTSLPFAGQALNKASTENGKGFAAGDPSGPP